MDALVNAVLVLIAQEGPGRGENPDEGTGVIAIVVIAAIVLVVGLVLVQVFRRGRVRPESQLRRPDEQGHAGRVHEFRDED